MPTSNNAGGGAGGATVNIARPRGFDHHVLTNGRGHYVALLCRRTGRLERLKGARA